MPAVPLITETTVAVAMTPVVSSSSSVSAFCSSRRPLKCRGGAGSWRGTGAAAAAVAEVASGGRIGRAPPAPTARSGASWARLGATGALAGVRGGPVGGQGRVAGQDLLVYLAQGGPWLQAQLAV